MKKFVLPVIVAGLSFMMASCTKDSPEQAVTSFLEAVNERNWDDAKQFATTESESMIDMVKGFAEMVPDSADTPMTFEIVKDKTVIDGDSATVVSKDENGNEMEYKVIKVEDKWKVNFTIEALMGDMMTEEVIDNALETAEDTMDSISIETDTMMETMDK